MQIEARHIQEQILMMLRDYHGDCDRERGQTIDWWMNEVGLGSARQGIQARRFDCGRADPRALMLTVLRKLVTELWMEPVGSDHWRHLPNQGVRQGRR